jgi:hypothetical protein
MSTDQILQKILANPDLKKKYWPKIEDPSSQNVNTILKSDNIYLRYLHAIFSDQNDNTRTQAIANLLN